MRASTSIHHAAERVSDRLTILLAATVCALKHIEDDDKLGFAIWGALAGWAFLTFSAAVAEYLMWRRIGRRINKDK